MHTLQFSFIAFVLLEILVLTESKNGLGIFLTADGKLKGYFIVNNSRVNWFKARKYCRENGMQLLRNISEEEGDFIMNRINETYPQYYKSKNNGYKSRLTAEDIPQATVWWTAGNNLLDPDVYFWDDREPIAHPKLLETHAGRQSAACLETSTFRRLIWSPAPCTKRNPFICEYFLKDLPAVTDVDEAIDSFIALDVLVINPEVPVNGLFSNTLQVVVLNYLYLLRGEVTKEQAENTCRTNNMILMSDNARTWEADILNYTISRMTRDEEIWVAATPLDPQDTSPCVRLVKRSGRAGVMLQRVSVDCNSLGSVVCVNDQIKYYDLLRRRREISTFENSVGQAPQEKS